MIVVDVNIVIYLVLRGEFTAWAELVAEKDDDWRAPRLVNSEMLNVLSGYIRRGTINLDAAMHAFREGDTAIRGFVAVDAWRVLELVRSSACTSYDCEYVAAAEALQVPLITNDRKIVNNFPALAMTMNDFLAS